MRVRIKGYLVIILMILLIFGITTTVYANNIDYGGHYAEKNIQSLIDAEIVRGYEDGSFKPNNNITRAEFITIVNRAFNFRDIKKFDFIDVNIGDWHYNEIGKAMAEGYIAGYGDGRMGPNNNITRQEAAVILDRIIDINKENNEILNKVNDLYEIPSWSKNAVENMIKAGYFNLDTSSNFNYNTTLIRADMAVAIDRALKEKHNIDNNIKDEKDTSNKIDKTKIRNSNNNEDYVELTIGNKLNITGKTTNTNKFVYVAVENDRTGDKESDVTEVINNTFSLNLNIPTNNGEYTVLIGTNNERYGTYSIYVQMYIEKINGITTVKTNDTTEFNMNAFNSRKQLKDIYSNTDDIRNKDEIYKILSSIINDTDTNYEKALKINNWVADNIYYNRDYLTGKTDKIDVKPVDVLRTKLTVCQGYSELTDAMIKLAGIPSRVVTGYALGIGSEGQNLDNIGLNITNHAWNEVYVDGRWVIIDTTWNSTNKYIDGKYMAGDKKQTYFDPTIEFMSNTHKFNGTIL